MGGFIFAPSADRSGIDDAVERSRAGRDDMADRDAVLAQDFERAGFERAFGDAARKDDAGLLGGHYAATPWIESSFLVRGWTRRPRAPIVRWRCLRTRPRAR